MQSEYSLVELLLPLVLSSLVSFVVAWFTSRRALRLEEMKLRLAAESAVLEKLTEKRLLSYPRLWSLIHVVLGAMRDGPASADSIRSAIENWDAEHSILLGPQAVNRMYEFRLALRSLPINPSAGQASSLQASAEALELALRSDLGIYGLTLNNKASRLTSPRIPGYASGEHE